MVATSFFLFSIIGVATSIRCRDLTLSPSTAILVTTSKVCRDHPFFLSSCNIISQSQQFSFNFSISSRDLDLMSRHEFLLPAMLIFVATMFFVPFNKFYVMTSVPCHDLAVLFSTAFYVATSKVCRDLIFVVNH